MTASFITELFDTFSLNHKAYGVEPARSRCLNRTVTPSTFYICTTLIGLRQLPHEKFSIVSALGGSNFNGN